MPKGEKMNILYVSSLEGGKYTGPRYSVPKQIMNQSYYDNVYWINLTNIDTNFVDCIVECHNYILNNLKIDSLPNPDLVIFEEFYKIPNAIFARQLKKKHIPYIIIPRSQMTKQYMKNKSFKKRLAAIALFNNFANNAISVQFLSNKEKEDSNDYYSGRSFIMPNGISMPSKQPKENTRNKVIGVFIGRYSVVQKGIDLLFEAIKENKELLKEYNVAFFLYGPDERTGSKDHINKLCKEADVEDIVTVNGPVFDDKKEKVLRNADFFVHTSRFEGLSMSILEALSYGLPCLVTEGTNIKEEIEHAGAGWGCETSVKGIGEAFKALVKSDEYLQDFSERARNLASCYSKEKIASNSHSIYEELIK